MTLYEIMYALEHRLLPNLFYKDKMKFIAILLDHPEVLNEFFDKMCQQEKIVNPYTKDDFQAEPYRVNDEIVMAKITFPEPIQEPLCYCVYLLFDLNFKQANYYCIERGTDENDLYVCSWDAKENHYNYGHCTWQDDYERCKELFLNQVYKN